MASRRSRGFALIVVLNVVAILSGIALVASEGSREGAAISANFRNELVNRAIAEGAMAMAAYRIATGQGRSQWIPDGRPYHVKLFGTTVEISVQDESGKLSLNAGDQTMLAHAFANAGLDPSRASALSAAIADWRDPDDDRRFNGAERPDYAALGRPESPANAPFQSADDLRGVFGMTEAIYRKLRPLVTAYSSDPSVNLNAAPIAVLDALFGANSPQVAAILARRTSVAAVALAVGAASGVSRSDGVTRQSGSATAATFSVVVTLIEDRARPRYQGAFQIAQDWRGARMSVVEAIERASPGGTQ